ncbi:MAG: aminotransferase class I/II-fold pyridoxal phosphate-dependent enzyme [FCB group bacterium]|nr:aminotransferase class I/II-fold pyridoxal phosphate-dependent enzyme [FCB group bacterium]
MIEPARRLSDFKEYYFSGKLQEIDRLNRAGKDIINLGIGNPDRMPPSVSLKTLQREITKEDAHGYQPYRGTEPLRTAMAKWYRRIYGISLNADREILPLMGSKAGILHISMAFLNPGDEVLIPDPGYPAYSSVTKMVGAVPRYFSLNPEVKWQPEFSELEKLDLSRVKLMWLNYPNMPTGASASENLFSQAVEFGRRNGVLICHDNPYSLILNDSPLSILSVSGARQVAVELNSLSKSHNMAGWRIGMAVSDEKKIGFIQTVQSNMDSGMFRPLQLGAASALDCGREWYDRQNNIYQQRQKIAFQILDVLHCTYDKPQSGLFVWARIPSEFADSEAYSEYILKTCDTFLCPGHIFGTRGKNYIRLSLCSSRQVLRRALGRVQHFRN